MCRREWCGDKITKAVRVPPLRARIKGRQTIVRHGNKTLQ